MYKCNVECNVNVELLEHGIYTEYYVILEAQKLRAKLSLSNPS